MLVIANLLAINIYGMQKSAAVDDEVSQLSQSLEVSAPFSDESPDEVTPVSTGTVATMTDPFIPTPMVHPTFLLVIILVMVYNQVLAPISS